MRRIVAIITFMAVSVAALATGTAVARSSDDKAAAGDLTNGPHKAAAYAAGEVLVTYKKNATKGQRTGVRNAAGATLEKDIPAFDTQLLGLPAQASVMDAVERLNGDPRVAFAEPNYRIELTATVNDPSFSELWGFTNTGQPHGISDPPPTTLSGIADADADVNEAWDTETGEASTVIAVVDSGVDVTHPDLDGSLWTNPGESGGGKETDGIDNDGNGYVDDVFGWDTAGNDNTLLESPPISGYDHGTHVAGTIAAEANNGIGVAGVCPGCKIMVLKFMKPVDFDGDGIPDGMSGFASDEIEALAYARKKGADIVNGSYGSFGFSLAERNAIAKLQKKNILGVFAASNSAGDNDLAILDGFGVPISPGYPASFNLPHILAVAASAHDDRFGYFTGCASPDQGSSPRWICAFTNYGQQAVDLAAPGVDTYSTLPGNTYDHFNGTSMASPFAAGVAGLVKSHKPNLTPVQIKNAIMRGTDKPANLKMLDAQVIALDDYPGKWVRTNGRINADVALDKAGTTAGIKNFGKTDGNINGARKLKGKVSDSAGWGPAGDVNDVFKKKLEKGTKYKVILNGAAGNTYGCCSLDMIVWGPGTKEIYQWTKFVAGGFEPTSNDEKFTFKAKKAGNHFFQVNSFLSDKFKYNLNVKKV